jgi:hypothetical protein
MLTSLACHPIALLAGDLRREAPGAILVLANWCSRRSCSILPLLERDGERVCLGIWDGRRIIAAAAWHG